MTTVRAIVMGLVATTAVLLVVGWDWANRGSDSRAGSANAGVLAEEGPGQHSQGSNAVDQQLSSGTTSVTEGEPVEISEGQGFDFGGLRYNDGWRLAANANGKLMVDLTTRNLSSRRATHAFNMSIMQGNKMVASADCITALLPSKRTDAVKCASADDWPIPHDEIVIDETFGQPLHPAWVLAPESSIAG